jgi:hypothetical protein
MCGEMGLLPVEMYEMTPREFFSYREGFINRRVADSNFQLIMVRKVMWATMTPHYKNLKENDLFELDFEQNIFEQINDEEKEIIEQEKQKVLDFWKKYDAAKATC